MTQAKCMNCGQPFQPGQSIQAFLRSPDNLTGDWTEPQEIDDSFQARFANQPDDIKRRHFDVCNWHKVERMEEEWKDGIPAVGERVAFNRLDRFELEDCNILRSWEDGEELEVLAIMPNNGGKEEIPLVWNHRTCTGQGINPDLIRPLETPAERRYKVRIQQMMDDSMTKLPGHENVEYSLTFAQAEALVAKGWVKAIPLTNGKLVRIYEEVFGGNPTKAFLELMVTVESVVRGEKEL